MKRPLAFLLAAAATVLAAWLFWKFVLFQIVVTTNTFSPCLVKGDRVLVVRTTANAAALPARQSLVAMPDPLAFQSVAPALCLARVTALPGDTIWMPYAVPCDTIDSLVLVTKPFVIPAAGSIAHVEPWNMALIANALIHHERRNVCSDCNDALVVDGQALDTVRFAKNYVWLGPTTPSTPTYGSFVYGLVSTEYLAGRLVCISYSLNDSLPFYQRLRLHRLFKPVE